MTRYYGCKPFQHDSTVFAIDCDRKDLFGVSLERTTRLKRDNGHICLLDLPLSMPVVNLSFGPDNEYQALREVIPLELGLFESPARAIIRDPHLSSEEKLERAGSHGSVVRYSVEAWLKIADAIETCKYSRIDYDHWEKIILARLRRFGTHTLKGWDHHSCHAASAYFHSGFNDCVAVTLDGWGNNCFSKVFKCSGHTIRELGQSSLLWTWGVLYGRITQALGLFLNSDEGKVEARAAYGEPDGEMYRDLTNGYIISDLAIHGQEHHLRKYWLPDAMPRLRDKLGEETLAATVQRFLEDKAVEYIAHVVQQTRCKRLAFAGGIFGNVKMNQNIFERCDIEAMFVVPAMNDSGSAQGAAYLAALAAGENLDWLQDKVMPYWGPTFSDLQSALNDDRICYKRIHNAAAMISEAICMDQIVALYQGHQEFGPRALGNRSILANALGGEDIKNRVNNSIKKREWYQPFCPSILASERQRLFEKSYKNKHMTCAFTMRPEHYQKLTAVAHIDKSSRPQFVEQNDNPLLYEILCELRKKTGYGVVLNTSFNLHGRAMVLTPQHAVDDFCDCHLDGMYLEGYWITRNP